MEHDWGLIATIIGASAAVVALIYGFLWNFKTEINGHIDRLDKDLKNQLARIDAQGARTDRLYQMFVENQKEMNDRFWDMQKKSDEKFSELLRGNRGNV